MGKQTMGQWLLRKILFASLFMIVFFAYDIVSPSPATLCGDVPNAVGKTACSYLPSNDLNELAQWTIWIVKKTAFMITTIFIIYVLQGRANIGR